MDDLLSALTEAGTHRSASWKGEGIFDLVRKFATSEQWAQWLRVPLEYAAAKGNADLFKALTGAGADGSAGWRGRNGRTLLHAAALGGSADVMSGLLDAGAGPDVNVVSAWSSYSSKASPLYVAASHGHEDVARLLVKAGADVNCPGGTSILSRAVEHECEELVNDLLRAGADPNWDEYAEPDYIALHLAVANGSERIVSALLAAGARKNTLDTDDETPLIAAAIRGKASMCEVLLQAGVDAEFRDVVGLRAFDLAAKRGRIDVMKVFLRHGVDVSAADQGGETALHCAAQNGESGAVDVLIMLLEAGANIEAKTWRGWTPLAVAARFVRCNAMRLLLQHGANAHVQDLVKGDSLCHMVCRRRRGDVEAAMDLLLRSGADENTLNNDMMTPAQLLELNPPDLNLSRYQLARRREARALLIRAPNDRAWRRRGWLVMLRSRASKVATCLTTAGNGGGSSSVGCPENRGGSKMARTQHAGGGEDSMLGQVSAGFVFGAGDEGLQFRTAVASLVELELEGVFRAVVGFL